MPTTILDGETYEQARHRRFTEEAKVIEKMQQDEIIRMARLACAPNQTFNSDEEWVKRFAALVAAHEREKQAEQDPVAYVYEKDVAGLGMRKDVAFIKHVEVGTDLYAAPVRTKDLTDDEIWEAFETHSSDVIKAVRTVIAADREKNKC